MGKIIPRDNFDIYAVLPNEASMLYIKYKSKQVLGRLGFFPANLTEIVSDGLKIDVLTDHWIDYEGEKGAEGLFWFNPIFYRGEIDQTKIGKIGTSALEKSLLVSEEDIDSNHELIIETANSIKENIKNGQHNPDTLGLYTLLWMENNIKYTILPKDKVNLVASIMADPMNKKMRQHEIIKKAFPDFYSHSKKLGKVADKCSLKKFSDSYDIAQDFLMQLHDKYPFLQFMWQDNNYCSASTTLKEKAGKCLGIANLYVALLRAMGIPSMTLHGHAKSDSGIEGGHAWAALYLPNYGFKEVDPTLGQYDDFSYNEHEYDLFSLRHYNRFDKIMEMSFIGRDEENKNLNDVINLIKRKQKTDSKKYEKELNFLYAL